MTEIPWLEDEPEDDGEYWFPAIEDALTEPDGLLAAGGDLSPERLISAYKRGIFPWFDDHQPFLWWSPSPRCVMFPEEIHISKSLAKTIRKNRFEVSFDRDFNAVICACSDTRAEREGTWITEEMIDAYCELHQLGIAHSVECWLDGELVGGLYGLSIGKIFFGESMFSTASDASKVAYVALAKQLQAWDFALIDCQVSNSHLLSLGAKTIGRADFKQYLNKYTSAATPDWSKASADPQAC